MQEKVKGNQDWAASEFASCNAQTLNVQVMLHTMTERITKLEATDANNKEVIEKQGKLIEEHNLATRQIIDDLEKRLAETGTKVYAVDEAVKEQAISIGDHGKDISSVQQRCDRQETTENEVRCRMGTRGGAPHVAPALLLLAPLPPPHPLPTLPTATFSPSCRARRRRRLKTSKRSAPRSRMCRERSRT